VAGPLSARGYFIDVVVPAYERFVAIQHDGIFGNSRDKNAFAESASALLHMADHVARDPSCNMSVPGKPKSGEYIKALTHSNIWFAIVRDAANACKHGTISRDRRTLDSSDAIQEAVMVVRYRDCDGFYCDIRKCVLMNLNDGRQLLADRVLKRCLAFWVRELVRLRAIPASPTIDHGPARHKTRNQVPDKLSMRAIGEVGEKFHMPNCVRDYDETLDSFVRYKTGMSFSADIEFVTDIGESRFKTVG
jgi:hypothetical protein